MPVRPARLTYTAEQLVLLSRIKRLTAVIADAERERALLAYQAWHGGVTCGDIGGAVRGTGIDRACRAKRGMQLRDRGRTLARRMGVAA